MTVKGGIRTKLCPTCGDTLPIEDFMRRVGQPFFLNAGRAWPAEPLVDKTEMAFCCVCFATAVIRESNGS